MRRASIRSSFVIVAAAVLAALVVLGLLSSYWVFLLTSVLITAVALQSLGLVAGRTGMIALCQMSFAGVGAWTAMVLCYRPTLALYGRPGREGLLLPIAAIFYVLMTLDSARAHWLGRGGAWKGRTYGA